MNKEIAFVCAFIMSIMVFSSFTPFAYAIKDTQTVLSQETKTINLATDVKSSTCGNDIWRSKMNWTEYQNLIKQSVQVIDGWGNQQANAQELAYNDAGVGTNPEAANSKDLTIPGSQGDTALLYDVVKNKAVQPEDVCHLSNLMSDGRMYYAGSLNNWLRYCPSDSNSSAYCTNKSKTEYTVPDSVVESDDALFTLNADTSLFFPKTRGDFLSFLRGIAWVDQYIGTMNTIGMVGGVASGGIAIAAGTKNFIKTGIKYGWKAGLLRVTKFGKSAESTVGAVKAAEKAIDEAKDLAKELPGIVSPVKKQVTGNLKELWTGEGAGAATSAFDAADLTKDTFKEMTSKLASMREAGTDLLTSADAEIIVKEFIAGVGGDAASVTRNEALRYLNPFNAMGGSQSRLFSDLAKGYNMLGNPATAQEGLEIINGAATKATVESLITSPGFKGFRAIATEEGWSTAITATMKYYLTTYNKGFLGYALRATQVTQMLFMGSLWLKNVVLAQPQFQFTGSTVFELNTSIDNFANKNLNEGHYLDVRKTSGYNNLGDFLLDWMDVLKSISPLGAGDNALGLKAKNIQDIIFIMDQDGLQKQGSEPSASNVVTVSETGAKENWLFTTHDFSGRTLIYNFEHPRGYTPSGISALTMHLSNINMYSIITSESAEDRFKISGLDNIANLAKIGRDFSFAAALIGVLPVGGRVLESATGLGGRGIGLTWGAAGRVGLWGLVGAGIFAGIWSIFPWKEISGGEIFDVREINRDKLCKDKFTGGDKDALNLAAAARGISSTISAGSSFIPTGPGIAVTIIADLVNLGVSWLQTDRINSINKDLETCLDTEFDVLSYKIIPSPVETQKNVLDILAPLKADAMSIFSLFAPQVNQQFDALASQLKQEIMHIQVHAENLPYASTTATEIYNVWFSTDANIKWMQDTDCNIDMCQEQKDGKFKCLTGNGYRIFDEYGNILQEGPQALSLHSNVKELYMGMVQEVIEVAKKDSQDLMMEIYPDKVTLSGDCLISEFGSLTHTTGMKDYQKEQIESLFGNLEEISTDNALLWFDGSDVKARFGKDTTCSDGTEYVAGDVTAFTDSHFQVFRDRDGTIKVVGNTDGNTKCEFKLGAVAGNAIGFSNAFVRSGMAQKARTIAIAGGGTKELPEVIDYKDVFHIFIYTLVSRPASDILSYTMSPVDVTECSLPDGTPGFKIKINTANPGDDSTTQWNDALGDICLTNVQGADDSLINIHDGNMTVTDPTGLTKEWKVVGFDAACKDDFRDFLGPAYKVTTQDGTKTACLSVDVGPNGQPEFKINAQAPIPLLFANGMGGGLYYDSGSGKISIKNEFGFPLNQAFKITGAGGLTMMTPSYPPTGGRTTGSESVSVASNPLAALPWTPSGLELILFIIALCGGLIFVRIKYRKTS